MSRFSNRCFGLRCLVAVATADSQIAQAADITVANGETRATSQNISNPGEQVTVEPMGVISISTSDSQGIFLGSAGQAATNLGVITTSGDRSIGVAADHANDASIINIGAIRAFGLNSGGVHSQFSDNIRITNTGIIQSSNVGLNLIGSLNATIQNTGSITTLEEGSRGIHIAYSAAATVTNNGAIETRDNQSYGISADYAHGTTITNDGVIRSLGSIRSGGVISQFSDNIRIINTGIIQSAGVGVVLFSSPNATFQNDGSITTLAENSHGIDIVNSAAATVTNNGRVETRATFADGIAVRSAGVTAVNNGTIALGAAVVDAVNGSHGIAAYDTSGSNITNNGLISNTNAGGLGVRLFNVTGATVINGPSGRIMTSGSPFSYSPGAEETSDGISVIESTLAGNLTNAGSVMTTGARAHGISTIDTGAATIENSGSITVSGIGSHAVYFKNAAETPDIYTLINTSTGSISSTNGDAIRDEAGAVWIWSSGHIIGDINAGAGDDRLVLTGTSSTVGQILMGTGSDALTVQGAATVAGVTVLDGGSDHLAADGAVDRLAFDGATLTQDATRLRNWEQIVLGSGSVVTFSGTSLLVGSGGERGGSALGLTVGAGTRLAFAASAFSIAGDVVNAGTISLHNGRAGDTLTVAVDPSAAGPSGRYVGQGGRLVIDTVLNDSASATDWLSLSGGAASGRTALDIRNAGGAGAMTTGDGINVVQALNRATSVEDSFALSGPVTAGPYEYTLFRGGIDPDNANSWYLRSTLDCGLDANARMCATTRTSQAPIPNYRQEVSLYSALPQMATLYGRTLLDSLHERVGEEEQLRGRLDLQGSSRFNGVWARAIGQFGQHEGGKTGIYGNDGAHFDYQTFALQMGLDVYRRETDSGHRDHVGIYGAIGRMSGDVWHAPGNGRAGTNRLDGYTVGTYWTHFGPSGWYLDTIAQATRYDAHATSTRPGYSLDAQGWGLAGSLEGGVPLHFSGGWVVEPQAQLTYQNVSLDSASDRSARFDWSNVSSLAGRVGLRVARTWQQDGEIFQPPRLTTIWGRVNLWHEFLGKSAMSVSSRNGPVPFHGSLAGAWAELQVGATSQLTRTAALYGSAGAKFGLDGRSQVYEGRVGVRINW